VRTDPFTVAPDSQARDLQHAHESRQDILAAAVTTGLHHATMSQFDRQAEITYAIDDQSRYQDILSAGLPQCLQDFDDLLPPHTSAHTRRMEARHYQNRGYRRPGLHMLGDVVKDLPEDSELEDLVDIDILGLVPPTSRTFDLVDAEVRERTAQ